MHYMSEKSYVLKKPKISVSTAILNDSSNEELCYIVINFSKIK
jgi:hypothetical protein